jgi:WXG100 family type VII secretion target
VAWGFRWEGVIVVAGSTTVSIPGMVRAQGDFQTALEQVNTAYGDMAEEQATLAANWTGESASRFGVALSSWLDDLKVVQSGLALILEKLASNTHVYANTDEGSTQMAGAFQKGLSGLQGLQGL